MSKPKITYFIFITLCIAGCIACGKNRVLSRDKMVEVLADIQVARSISQNQSYLYSNKSQQDALIEGVFRKHKITQAQLDSSLVWYSDNITIYNRVNDSVIAKLRREMDVQNKILAQEAASKKSKNRLIPEYTYLTESAPILSFSLDSLQAEKHPDFSLEFKTLGTSKKTLADFSISFTYRDTIIRKSLVINADTSYKIGKPLQNDTLKSISGYVYLRANSNLKEKVLLYNIHLTDKKEELVKKDISDKSSKKAIPLNTRDELKPVESKPLDLKK
jgi:hypothetical protein